LQHVPVISIVDDDESVRIAMNSLVRSLGYIAHTFASAEDFLRSPRLNETSCLITDVQMPGMNGIECRPSCAPKGSACRSFSLPLIPTRGPEPDRWTPERSAT
jgi:FixJ family two-component response regulator